MDKRIKYVGKFLSYGEIHEVDGGDADAKVKTGEWLYVDEANVVTPETVIHVKKEKKKKEKKQKKVW